MEHSEPDFLSPPSYLSQIFLAEGRYEEYLQQSRLAARLLGIGKTTLYRKLKEYGIGAPEAEEVRTDGSASPGL